MVFSGGNCGEFRIFLGFFSRNTQGPCWKDQPKLSKNESGKMVAMFFFRLNRGNVLEEIDDSRDDQHV